ncbi:MAG: WXG100 family type VII secretion target [Kineosporiaceae bacterium]|nr:WXG100 family type VII secretion target [Kineosporiaceae bacterium]MBK7623907.1 WXG100 family type VII secretion target [Kineosporiaceae bacterium]
MANVHVDYAELGQTASKLKGGQAELETKLKQLNGLVQSLVSSGFVTDRASGKFRESYERWNKGAVDVVAGLEGMSAFLNKAISDHQNLDSQLGQGV